MDELNIWSEGSNPALSAAEKVSIQEQAELFKGETGSPKWAELRAMIVQKKSALELQRPEPWSEIKYSFILG
jgi:hypothetical protein